MVFPFHVLNGVLVSRKRTANVTRTRIAHTMLVALAIRYPFSRFSACIRIIKCWTILAKDTTE